MKGFKVIVNVYHYWKDSCGSGYIAEEHYFLNEDKADAFIDSVLNNPYWVNFNHEKELTDNPYKAPSVKKIEIEIEG